jgi:predicted nucleic acid-binding protein
MSVYFDASLIVPLFVQDAFTPRAESYIRTAAPTARVSDFAAAEFASAVNRRVRMGLLASAGAQAALANFDAWRRRGVLSLETTSDDIATADAFLRRLDLPLRTPDALNIALADRCGASLATFDDAMARCASALGVPLEML